MEKPTGSAPAGAKDQVEKQARQLAYDVRYKVRGALKAQSGGKSDPATVRKAYLAQLGKSPASPPVKARAKDMLIGEGYVDVNKLATESAVSALYRVFVEGIHEQEEIQEDSGEKTYKVRVTDKKSGNSYVRMASRAKISELRNNPNISSVEMTGYGEPARSEKYAGKKTAAAKAGKDFDGDGKKESSSKEHAGVVHNAIQKKKGGIPDGKDTRKEDYSWKDGFSELIEKKKDEKKLTGKGVNNKKLIKVFPVEENKLMDPEAGKGSGLSGLGGMDVEGAKEKGAQKQIAAKQKKADQIKKQVLLKKLQAVRMGGGEDIVASHQPEGDMVEDAGKTIGGAVVDTVLKDTGVAKEIGGIARDAIRDKRNLLRKMRREKPLPDKVDEGKEEGGYISNAAKAEVRNQRRFGKKGSATPQGYFGQKPSEKAELAVKRGEEHRARRGVKTKGMKEEVVDEAKVDTVKYGVMSSPEKEKARNERKFGKLGWNQGGQSQLRKGVHWSKRGEKKVRGAKDVEEDAKYGYDSEGNSLNPKDKKKKQEQEDPRSMGTKYRNIKNRLRSMGLNMSHQPEGNVIDEEGYDRMRDDRLVKYGIGHDGSDRKGSSSYSPRSKQKGDTAYQKEMKKKHGGKLPSAIDVVKARIEKEHGKGAIMDTKKK